MEPSAIRSAEMATMELGQSAGRTAQATSEMMEPTATSLTLMEEAPAPCTSATTARSGAPYGTQSAEQTSTTWRAVSARPTAQTE